jgi:hypothetical protein
MARQVGLVFTGKVDEFSFYYDRLHGYLVRRTGGATSKQYRTQERYAAARDASSEFTLVSRAGKLIRDALKPFVQPIKDGTMVNRLNKELVALKQKDTVHSRGKRRPETMMADGEANTYFRIFQFNEGVKSYELTKHFPAVIRKHDSLLMSISGLLPSAFPQGATHAGLTLVRAVIDFEKDCFETSSSRMAVVSCDNQDELFLEIQELPACAGIELVCLQVVFLKEQNGDLVQLPRAVHSMGIVAVGMVELPMKKGVSRIARPVRLRAGLYKKARILSRRKEKVFVVSGNYRYNGCSPPLKT